MRKASSTLCLLPLAFIAWGCPDSNSTTPDAGQDADGFVDTRPAPRCNMGTIGFSDDVFVDRSAEVGLRVYPAIKEDTEELCSNGADDDGDGDIDCDDSQCLATPDVTACGVENSDALCTDGLDNDGDGLSDCADPRCQSSSYVVTCGTEHSNPRCADAFDNDNDGLTDCEDPDCKWTSSVINCGLENSEALCADGLDNDGDGSTDCGDVNCARSPDVTLCLAENTDALCADGLDNDNSGAADCDDPNCKLALNMTICGPENSDQLCSDGRDNDGNGTADCNDPSCTQEDAAVTICAAEASDALCEDEFDNDGDGATDCDDPDCSQNQEIKACLGLSEENDDATCADGLDNDGDGHTDCADHDCSQRVTISVCGVENNDALCTDGLDNDQDGYTDCDDFDCSRTKAVAGCVQDPPHCPEREEVPSNALGFRIAGADLDGDEYVDLISITGGGNARGMHRVYMNRPDPDKPGKRIFIERFDSGIGSNRRDIACRSTAFHSAGDLDNDGDVDLYAAVYVSQLTDLLDRQEVLLNDGTGHFSLVEGESSLATIESPAETAAVWFDYDRDGILDLYIGNWYEHYGKSLDSLQDELWKGHGDGSFTRVTDQAGLTQLAGTGSHENHKPTYGLTHCDVDGDGWQDILEAAYGRQWNDLWLNRGDGTFSNIGESSNYDADALTDFSDAQFYLCYCRDNPDDCAPNMPSPSVNCSSRGWSNDDEAPFRQNGNTFGAYCGDYDNDGDLDVLLAEITHGWAGSASDRSMILQNDGQTGTDLTFTRLMPEESGVNREWSGVNWNEGDTHAAWFDYNNDGLLDVLINAAPYPDDRIYLFRQRANHSFSEMALGANLKQGNVHAPVLADYDLDGDVDMITAVAPGSVSGYPRAQMFLFENQLGQLNNWSRISLQGKGAPDGANRQGIGARVTVTSGSLTQLREVKSSAGQNGQQDETALTFGFNHRCDDLTIQVRWPNSQGTVQTFEGVRANYRLLLIEGEPEPVYLDAE